MPDPAPRPAHSRRAFLSDSGRSLSAGWLALHAPWLAALASCAQEDARSNAEFQNLTAAEARTMRAFAAQIVPAEDGLPGADDAGAVYFVDRAMVAPALAESAPIVRAGLADLDARARTLDAAGAREGFAALDDARQIAVMRQVEQTPFFGTARMLVLAGTFADPSYGGNRGGAGWRIAGVEHAGSFRAPFGWYDAQHIAGGDA